MNEAVAFMLEKFGTMSTLQDKENALQEIIQHITLLGLQRGGFFTQAAFYGGTALRMLYGLDRFSEDLDFCLNRPDPQFALKPFFPAIVAELQRFGFDAEVTEKKTGAGAAMESAFVKQSTYRGVLTIAEDAAGVHPSKLIKVRLEVDKQNHPGGELCQRLVKLPVPFMVQTLTEGSLFAGKIHAIIARSYLNRVKGRDYYDLMFYCSRGTPVNLAYLESKLRDSGHYQKEEALNREALINLLVTKFETVDFEKAKQDVRPFLKSQADSNISQWSKELFTALVEELAVSQ